ncbi:phage protein NinX family protein [Pantoea sp. ACRSB]|uniref:phage protein NinX family protein n=1 Tax=Pantoea sp. ACRSB TaxID=2918207 RepID=UPI0028932BE9|nr:phage protein NinX family protein [Pantoea sp. ACRSB]MCG7388773.1 DUF2591 domain-containing protein [Pantoea sp. ACRSB]
MNYSEMSDFEINCAVARAMSLESMLFFDVDSSICRGPVWNVASGAIDGDIRISRGIAFKPCHSWSDAGPIIENHMICLAADVFAEPQDGGKWVAQPAYGWDSERVRHDNPLRAAMISFLMMQEKVNE